VPRGSGRLQAVFSYFAPQHYCPTTTAVLEAAGARRTGDPLADWDLYLTTRSDALTTLLPSRTDQWIGRLPGAGRLSNKTALWQGLLAALGREGACALVPESWQLDLPGDRRLIAGQPAGTVFIAKDPILEQRRGLRLCADLPALLAAAGDGLTLAQRLLPDLLLIDGHRFHLRLYVVLIHRDDRLSLWRHPQGRCIWAPRPLGEALLEPDAVITRATPLPGRPIDLAGLLAYPEAPPALLTRIDALLSATVDAIAPALQRDWHLSCNPAFHLLGADVVVCGDGGVRLIELNSGPDLRPRSEADRLLKSAMVTDLLRLIELLPGPTGFLRLPLASIQQ
jgi:hypothetical protein